MLRIMHCLPAFHDTKTTVAQEIEEKFGLTEMEVTDEDPLEPLRLLCELFSRQKL